GVWRAIYFRRVSIRANWTHSPSWKPDFLTALHCETIKKPAEERLLRIRIEKGFWTSIWGLTILGLALAFVLSWFGLFTYYYVKYKRMIDARLSGNILQNTTQIFSAPQRIADGQVWSAEELASYLQRVGY